MCGRVVICALALAVLPVHAQAQDRSLDEQAIRERIKALEIAWNARDAKAAAAVFAEDGDLAIVTSPVYRGRAEVNRAWSEGWTRIPEGITISIVVRSVRFTTSDVALVDVEGHFARPSAARDVFPERDRAFFVIVRRQGSWQVAALRVFPASGPAGLRGPG